MAGHNPASPAPLGAVSPSSAASALAKSPSESAVYSAAELPAASSAGRSRMSMGSPAPYSPDTFSSSNFSHMDRLLTAAQLQQKRQLLKLQSLKRQAEAAAEQKARQEAKERAEAEARRKAQQEQKQKAAERAAAAAAAEARHRAAREQAAAKAEEDRRAYEAKVQRAADRAASAKQQKELAAESSRLYSAHVASRHHSVRLAHETHVGNNLKVKETKIQVAQNLIKQRQELKRIQGEIHKEEATYREEARLEAKLRAEQEAQAKATYYALKAEERERMLAARKRQAEEEKMARVAELAARNEAVRVAAAQAEAEAAAQREALRERLDDKARRAETMAEQRRRLMEQMRHIRAQMSMQEAEVKGAVSRMQHTGDFQLLESLERELEALQAFASPPPTNRRLSTTSSGGVASYRSPRVPSALPQPAAPSPVPALPVAPSPAPVAAPLPAQQPAGPASDERLAQLLEDEIRKEIEREKALAAARDPADKQRLLAQFATERAASKVLLLELSAGKLPISGA